MANLRIVDLPSGASFTGSEVFEIVQGGSSYKGTLAQILAYVGGGEFPVDFTSPQSIFTYNSQNIIIVDSNGNPQLIPVSGATTFGFDLSNGLEYNGSTFFDLAGNFYLTPGAAMFDANGVMGTSDQVIVGGTTAVWTDLTALSVGYANIATYTENPFFTFFDGGTGLDSSVDSGLNSPVDTSGGFLSYNGIGSVTQAWSAALDTLAIGKVHLITSATGDGTTDDTVAIQADITALEAQGGGVLQLKIGTYKVTSTINITGDNVIINGTGMASQVVATGDYGDIFFFGKSDSSKIFSCGITNLWISSATTRTSGCAVDAQYTYWFNFKNVRLGNASGVVPVVADVTPLYNGLYLNGQAACSVDHLWCYVSNEGVIVAGGSPSYYDFDGWISNLEIVGGTTGIHLLAGIGGLTINDVNVFNAANGLVVESGSFQLFLDNIFFDSNSGNGAWFKTGALDTLVWSRVWAASNGGVGVLFEDNSVNGQGFPASLGGSGYILANSGGDMQVGAGNTILLSSEIYLTGAPTGAGTVIIGGGGGGVMNFDSGTITSDGSGNITAASFIGVGDSLTFGGANPGASAVPGAIPTYNSGGILQASSNGTAAGVSLQGNNGVWVAVSVDNGYIVNNGDFCILDITGGGLAPFAIRQGAPSLSLDITNTGVVDFGVGISLPSDTGHYVAGDGSFQPIFDTGWTANADAGDKTVVIGSTASLTTIATALNLVSAGAGTALLNIAQKVKALESALAIALHPNN